MSVINIVLKYKYSKVDIVDIPVHKFSHYNYLSFKFEHCKWALLLLDVTLFIIIIINVYSLSVN